jgi:hypothetical protein
MGTMPIEQSTRQELGSCLALLGAILALPVCVFTTCKLPASSGTSLEDDLNHLLTGLIVGTCAAVTLGVVASLQHRRPDLHNNPLPLENGVAGTVPRESIQRLDPPNNPAAPDTRIQRPPEGPTS